MKKKVAWSRGVQRLKQEQAEAFSEGSLRTEVAFEDETKAFFKRAGVEGAQRCFKKRYLPDTDVVEARTRGQNKQRSMEAPSMGESSLIIRPGMLSTALRNRFGYLCAGA